MRMTSHPLHRHFPPIQLPHQHLRAIEPHEEITVDDIQSTTEAKYHLAFLSAHHATSMQDRTDAVNLVWPLQQRLDALIQDFIMQCGMLKSEVENGKKALGAAAKEFTPVGHVRSDTSVTKVEDATPVSRHDEVYLMMEELQDRIDVTEYQLLQRCENIETDIALLSQKLAPWEVSGSEYGRAGILAQETIRTINLRLRKTNQFRHLHSGKPFETLYFLNGWNPEEDTDEAPLPRLEDAFTIDYLERRDAQRYARGYGLDSSGETVEINARIAAYVYGRVGADIEEVNFE